MTFADQVKQVQVLGGERYLVGHTPHTLLLGDLANCKLSEVIIITTSVYLLLFQSAGHCVHVV